VTSRKIPEGYMDVSVHLTVRIKDGQRLRELADSPPQETRTWRGRASVRTFVKSHIAENLHSVFEDNGVDVEIVYPREWED
jgi:hypothetical protein